MEAVWDDRKENIEQIQTWLMETADTFIIVQGPRGSGKRELVVDQALKGKRHKLIIDCKPIQEARGDSATINAAAAGVGTCRVCVQGGPGACGAGAQGPV